MVFSPPERGPMLLVSLQPLSQTDFINRARTAGALTSGQPYGSQTLLVVANRASVLMPLLNQGILVLRAPVGCGEDAEPR
ncbi:hypothetical protein [Erythrobacter mangrovi]|uniref:Uncharacterized protein n=1 Tax=Erythrobacter mangrovi TaxID=2739433 RepID=A0A7D3X8R2_9SPHN|nr:hypothetical protein [Erythrobacter mangrovi]QKG70375.1 hypothetical protein HQR01_02740 [Erythrobacter mangrovi]